MTASTEHWSISSTTRCSSSKNISPDSEALTLDNVMAYNIELFINQGKKLSKIKLNGVPSFLVDAFSWLEKNNSLKMEGIFRKEGNSNRMKNTARMYFGLAPIPDECNTHDVCSMIKRFFREIRTPLFADNQNKILNFAESLKGQLLADAIFTVIERLPTSHVSTVAFLMRQLKRISDYSGENQMNAENLAIVFGPSLFRGEETHNDIAYAHKKKHSSQHIMLKSVKDRNTLQVLVVKLLIQTSTFIGVPQEEENFRFSPVIVQRITTSKTSMDLVVPTETLSNLSTSPISNRPSLAYFQKNNRGFVCQRAPQEEENCRNSPAIVQRITTSKTSMDPIVPTETSFNFSTLPISNRPSFAYFQKNNMGFVRQRVPQAEENFRNSPAIVQRITTSKTSMDLVVPTETSSNFSTSPISNRPSLAYFQKNNRGFVRQRISQFARFGQLALAPTKEVDENNHEP